MGTQYGMVLHLPDESATEQLAEDLAGILGAGDVVALSGDLGVGKTTLVRWIIRAIAGDPIEVPLEHRAIAGGADQLAVGVESQADHWGVVCRERLQ